VNVLSSVFEAARGVFLLVTTRENGSMGEAHHAATVSAFALALLSPAPRTVALSLRARRYVVVHHFQRRGCLPSG